MPFIHYVILYAGTGYIAIHVRNSKKFSRLYFDVY